ncbi:MAG: EAL domain-containing protein [Actinomycetes bacterium]
MDLVSRVATSTVGLLAAVVLAYPLLPLPAGAQTWLYNGLAVSALALGFAGVVRHRPVRRSGWFLILTGFTGWVLGDVVYSLEQTVWHLQTYPAPSDAFFLGSYAFLGAGALLMVRTRRAGRDITAFLDAAIIAVGTGVVAAVFVVAPLASDSGLTLAGKLVSSAYPLGDLLLLGILVRLWATPGARTSAFRLLTAALAFTLAADAVWNFTIVTTGQFTAWTWNEALWLASYVAVCASAWVPSMRTLAEPAPDREENAPTRRRLAALACGLTLPGVALLLDGAADGEVSWQITGIGSLLLCLLVLIRMAGLLHIVQAQAVRLAGLARADALTGAPNRRTWDHELSRACQVAHDTDQPLSVAMLDLDHFKAYNDAHGHQAGDLLLREAVAVWTDQLGPAGFLARYGGEEFALLLPGLTSEQARTRMDALRSLTPRQQTFSAGVATWDPTTEPGTAVAEADQALYEAKRAGRNRVALARPGRAGSVVPVPRIALQPIVDLDTGEVLAVEALSRFDHGSPVEVFAQAYREGSGAALEAAAVRAALAHRSDHRLLCINVSLPALITPEVQDALPYDLSRVVLEITEGTAIDGTQALSDLLAELRGRGAHLAIDDWGQGFSNLDRILSIQPETIKIDMSITQNLHTAYHRAAIRAIAAWADEVGATICAEGIETVAQRDALRALGIRLGQGYLLGRPEIPATPETRTQGQLASPMTRRS